MNLRILISSFASVFAQVPGVGGEDISWWGGGSNPQCGQEYDNLPPVTYNVALSDAIGNDIGGGLRIYSALQDFDIPFSLGSDFIAFAQLLVNNEYDLSGGSYAFFQTGTVHPNTFTVQVLASTYPPPSPIGPLNFHGFTGSTKLQRLLAKTVLQLAALVVDEVIKKGKSQVAISALQAFKTTLQKSVKATYPVANNEITRDEALAHLDAIITQLRTRN